MTPIQILNEEHQNILKMIALMRDKSVNSDQELDQEFWEKAIFFIQNYADKFHHAKEEEILFKEINAKEESMHCNPVGQMLYEHELGRGLVKEMTAGLANGDKEKVISNALNYAQLLEEHIFKEDKILYPMAESAIDESSWKKIAVQFEKVNLELKETQQKCLSFIKEGTKG